MRSASDLKCATKHAPAGAFWAHVLVMGRHAMVIIKPATRVFGVMGEEGQMGCVVEVEIQLW